jgi:hypothetical protein
MKNKRKTTGRKKNKRWKGEKMKDKRKIKGKKRIKEGKRKINER